MRMSSNDFTAGGYLLPGPTIGFGRKSVYAFQLYAVIGLAIGVTINLTLGARLGLPGKWSAGVVIFGLVIIPIIAMVEKIVNREEQLCFYHHLIGVLAATTILLWIVDQPLLPFLDLLILAAGAVRAAGYLGCFRAGCCHGRPSRWGVIYDDRYVSALPVLLINVRLFPVQLVEAAWTMGVVAIGCALVVRQYQPGTGLSWFIMTYCSARFFFECLRWPPNYHFKSGLSQHQWISVALVSLVVALEVNGVLPFRLWHELILALLLTATAGLVIERRTRSVTRELGHPEHIRELTAALRSVSHSHRFGIPVDCTSLGLQVSAGTIPTSTGDIRHYTLSRRAGLTKAAVDLLAKAVTPMQPARIEVLAGNNNVFHLLVHSEYRSHES